MSNAKSSAVMVDLPGAVAAYGSTLVAHLAGIEQVSLDMVYPGMAEVVCVSVHFPGQLVHLKKLFRLLGVSPNRHERRGKPFLLFGGYGTNNPEVLRDIADAVQCGDGEVIADFIAGGEDVRGLASGDLPGFFVPSDDDTGPPSQWPREEPIGKQVTACVIDSLRNVPPLLTASGATKSVATVEIARGCKQQCAFCLIGNSKPYREHDEGTVSECVSAGARLFAPDIGSLSWFHGQQWLATTAGGLSARAALQHPELIGSLAQPTMGIEGWSERLRRLVGKPISDDDLRGICEERLQAGKKGLLWYMLHSLPSSRGSDRAQFVELLCSLNAGVTITMVFTPFQKCPHTPLSYAAAHYSEAEYGWLRRIRRELSGGAKMVIRNGKRPVRHYVDTLMSCGAAGAGRMAVTAGPSMLNWPVERLFAVSKKMGTDLDVICDEWPETGFLPWGYVDTTMGDPRARYERSIVPTLEATGEKFEVR